MLLNQVRINIRAQYSSKYKIPLTMRNRKNYVIKTLFLLSVDMDKITTCLCDNGLSEYVRE